MRAASSLCLENMILIIDTFTCVCASLEFTYCVSTMGNLIALGFVTLKFGDVVVLKWWGGLVARGSFFHFRVSPGYRQSIAGNTWVVLPCLALFCLVPAAATAAGSAVPAAAVAAAYLPTTELRAPQGAHATVVTGRAIGVATSLRAWGQRPTLALSGMRAGRCANTACSARASHDCLFVWIASYCIRPCTLWLVASLWLQLWWNLRPIVFFNKIIQNNLKQWLHRCSVHNMLPNFTAIKNTEH